MNIARPDIRTESHLTGGSILALVGSMFVVGISFGAAAPLVSAILEERGFSEYFTGAVAAVLAVAIALFSPTAGRLVERRGPRRILGVGLVGQAAGFSALGLALAIDERLLFAARMGLGIGATLTFVAAEVALLRGVPSSRRGRVMAFYGAALSTGFAGGVFFSKLAYNGLGLWCFALVAAIALSVLPLAAWGMSKSSWPPTQNETTLGVRLAWSPIVLALYGSFVFGAIDTGMSGAYPVEAQRLGIPRDATLDIVGFMFLGTVVSQPLCGWLADRTGTLRVLGLVATTGLLAAVGTGLASFHRAGVPVISTGFFAIGFAAGGMYPVSLKLLADRVQTYQLPRANARFTALYGYASILGPLLAAAGIDGVESVGRLGWAVPGMCALIFGSLLPLILWDRKRHRSD